MTATIITVGDEILIGQIVNSNAAWLGEQLGLVGVDVMRMETVGDDVRVIQQAIERGLETSDLVVATGGLGPTHDDVTREAVASSFGVPLVFQPGVMVEVERVFIERRWDLPEANRKLAEVPEGFEPLLNPKGTAPGLWGERKVAGRMQCLIVLPGVPYEMKAIMREHVLPRLLEISDTTILHKTLLTVGQGESSLAEHLGDLSDVLTNGISLAYLPGAGIVRLRVSARGADQEVVQAGLDRAVERLRNDLGDRIFGEDGDTLEGVLGDMLVVRGLTIAVAESCTGGSVASRITRVPGSSGYFLGGVVAYDNRVKIRQLGVSEADLEEHGAVGEPVVRQMAEGVRIALGADIGVATTGIAGPDGGTPEKPVGTVWLGYVDAQSTYAVRVQLSRDRVINIRLSTTAALNLVRRQLLRTDRLGASKQNRS